MKHVDVAALAAVDQLPMTRQGKLMRWVSLVRNHPTKLQLYSGLEYWADYELAHSIKDYHIPTAFGIAVKDPVFREQGLKQDANVKDIMSFFELTQQELHTFSCNCGGYIDNQTMASRIERLANR